MSTERMGLIEATARHRDDLEAMRKVTSRWLRNGLIGEKAKSRAMSAPNPQRPLVLRGWSEKARKGGKAKPHKLGAKP